MDPFESLLKLLQLETKRIGSLIELTEVLMRKEAVGTTEHDFAKQELPRRWKFLTKPPKPSSEFPAALACLRARHKALDSYLGNIEYYSEQQEVIDKI